MNLTEQEIRRIARDEIKKFILELFSERIRSLLGFNYKDIEYLPTSKAYKKLGFPSHKALRKAVYDGLFRVGKEVQDRRRNDSYQADYYFNIQACIKRLDTPPEKRIS